MDACGYIYITTNTINGKRYIGKHQSQEFDKKYLGSGKILKQAIKKYGIENFACFPLAWCWSLEELNQLEIDYIAHYRPEYNISAGGDGGNMLMYASEEKKEERKKKISSSNKGKKSPMLGKTHTNDVCMKISASLKGNKRRLGKIHSEETRAKLSKKNIGNKNPMYEKNHSEETRAKMSEARKLYWQKRKEEEKNVQT
jgi:hypothetical protein